MAALQTGRASIRDWKQLLRLPKGGPDNSPIGSRSVAPITHRPHNHPGQFDFTQIMRLPKESSESCLSHKLGAMGR